MQRGVEATLTSFLGHFLPTPQPMMAQGGQGRLVAQIHNVQESTKPCGYLHLY